MPPPLFNKVIDVCEVHWEVSRTRKVWREQEVTTDWWHPQGGTVYRPFISFYFINVHLFWLFSSKIFYSIYYEMKCCFNVWTDHCYWNILNDLYICVWCYFNTETIMAKSVTFTLTNSMNWGSLFDSKKYIFFYIWHIFKQLFCYKILRQIYRTHKN